MVGVSEKVVSLMVENEIISSEDKEILLRFHTGCFKVFSLIILIYLKILYEKRFIYVLQVSKGA